MYCICEKKYTESDPTKREIAISIIKFPENFTSVVSDIVTKAYKITHTILTETLSSSDKSVVAPGGSLDSLKASKDHQIGFYLLTEGKDLVLVEKKEVVLTGRFYNSHTVTVDRLYKWKLLSFEFPVSCETEDIIDTVETVIPEETLSATSDSIESLETTVSQTLPTEEIEVIANQTELVGPTIEINLTQEEINAITAELEKIINEIHTINIAY